MRRVEASLGQCHMSYFADGFEDFRTVTEYCQTNYLYRMLNTTLLACASQKSDMDPVTHDFYNQYDATYTVEMVDYLDEFYGIPIERVTQLSMYTSVIYPKTLTQSLPGAVLASDPVIQAVLRGVKTECASCC